MSSRGQDFGQRPLIAGSFVGIRSWRVGPLGVLTGVHVRAHWNAEENAAQCVGTPAVARSIYDALASAAQTSAALGWALGKMAASLGGTVYLRKRPKINEPAVPRGPHPVASLACTCGFYAYFDLDDNPHHMDRNVLGLIEGYGTMTIGARGFRASKARIVALVEPVPSVIRAKYPVPIFATIEAALAEFPLSVPPAIEPTHPDAQEPAR